MAKRKEAVKKVDYQQMYCDLLSASADHMRSKISQLSMMGMCVPHTLYYKASADGKMGDLQIFRDGEQTGGWIATEHVLRMDVEFSRYWQWLRDRTGNLPIIAC